MLGAIGRGDAQAGRRECHLRHQEVEDHRRARIFVGARRELRPDHREDGQRARRVLLRHVLHACDLLRDILLGARRGAVDLGLRADAGARVLQSAVVLMASDERRGRHSAVAVGLEAALEARRRVVGSRGARGARGACGARGARGGDGSAGGGDEGAGANGGGDFEEFAAIDGHAIDMR